MVLLKLYLENAKTPLRNYRSSLICSRNTSCSGLFKEFLPLTESGRSQNAVLLELFTENAWSGNGVY